MHSVRIWQKESFKWNPPSPAQQASREAYDARFLVLLDTTQGYLLVQDTQHKLCHFQQGIISVAVPDIPQTVGSI
jgi:hypothetical protein